MQIMIKVFFNINLTEEKEDWEKFQTKKYEVEMDCAIKMSLALEDEKKKLKDLEDLEFNVCFIL